MKVTSVGLFNDYTEDPLVLSFRDPSSTNPFQCPDIKGLDPDEIVRRFQGTGGSGSNFYEFVLAKRQLVATLGLNPQFAENESYSDLRDQIYRIISSSRTGAITLAFYNGATPVAVINGFISKVEAVQFARSPDTKLTIDCPYPMLRAPAELEVPIAGLDTANTVITDAISTAPHGVQMALKLNANATKVEIGDGDWKFSVTPLGGFLTDDVLHISTDLADKDIYIKRGSSTIYIADGVARNTHWPLMYPGPNTYKVTSASTSWVSIKHTPTYWGV